MKILYVGHSTVFPLTRGPRWYDFGYLCLLNKVSDQLRVLCPKMPPAFGEDLPKNTKIRFPDSFGFDYQYESEFQDCLKDIPGYREHFAYGDTYPLLFSIDMIFSNKHSPQLKKLIEEFDPDVVISCLCLDREYYQMKKFIFNVIDYYPSATAEFFRTQDGATSKGDEEKKILAKMMEFVDRRTQYCDGFVTGSKQDVELFGDRCYVVLPTTESFNLGFTPNETVNIVYSGTYGWHRFLSGFEVLKNWTNSYPEEFRKRNIKFSVFCNGPIPEGEFFSRQYRKIKGMDASACSFGIVPQEYTTGYPTKVLEYLANGLIVLRPDGDFNSFLSAFDAGVLQNPREESKRCIAVRTQDSQKLLEQMLAKVVG